ncbi:hypothetical protein Mapa_000829 [Marchantia paleacea]|nr:hypothetical protein Mapa_000829 [Marchantia paleacea]
MSISLTTLRISNKYCSSTPSTPRKASTSSPTLSVTAPPAAAIILPSPPNGLSSRLIKTVNMSAIFSPFPFFTLGG